MCKFEIQKKSFFTHSTWHGCLDWGSIRSSPRNGLNTPCRLTNRNSARLFHHVIFNMWDLHLVRPALNLSTLNAGILITRTSGAAGALSLVPHISGSTLFQVVPSHSRWTSRGRGRVVHYVQGEHYQSLSVVVNEVGNPESYPVHNSEFMGLSLLTMILHSLFYQTLFSSPWSWWVDVNVNYVILYTTVCTTYSPGLPWPCLPSCPWCRGPGWGRMSRWCSQSWPDCSTRSPRLERRTTWPRKAEGITEGVLCRNRNTTMNVETASTIQMVML